MRKISVSLVVLMALFLPKLASAQDGNISLTYQGTLSDSGGRAITGTRGVRFSLYTASEGGAAVWTEEHAQVDVVDGTFTSVLGRAIAFDGSLAGHQELYLGVRIEGDVEMTPRNAPWSRIRETMALVSTPCIAGTLSLRSQVDSVMALSQWWPPPQVYDPAIRPATWTPELSCFPVLILAQRCFPKTSL